MYDFSNASFVIMSTMGTKSRRNLWLLDKAPPVYDHDGPRGFHCARPPTGEEVLLQLHGYHRLNQFKTSRQSGWAQALAFVTEDLINWWERSGIEIKCKSAIKNMILLCNKKYINLKKSQKRSSKQDIQNRNHFTKQLKKTFWIVHPAAEKSLEENSRKDKMDERDKEDYNYLLSIKGEKRTGLLGTFDRRLSLRNERKNNAMKSLNEKKTLVNEYKKEFKPVHEIMQGDRIDILSNEEAVANPDIDWDHHARIKTPTNPKSLAIPDEAFLIADKYKISNRALTELAAVFLRHSGQDIEGYFVSPATTRRRRDRVRIERAASITRHGLVHLDGKFYALHWDSKKLNR